MRHHVFTVYDIALALRDHCEYNPCHHFANDKEQAGPAEITFIDISDKASPILYLDNGQAFTLTIAARSAMTHVIFDILLPVRTRRRTWYLLALRLTFGAIRHA